MANMKMTPCLVLVIVAMLCAGATAQSGCTNVLISLSPCLNYITGNSSTPSQQCCTQLASVVSASPQCLCQVLNGGGSSLGITINQTQALALPGSCNVKTPPISSQNCLVLLTPRLLVISCFSSSNGLSSWITRIRQHNSIYTGRRRIRWKHHKIVTLFAHLHPLGHII